MLKDLCLQKILYQQDLDKMTLQELKTLVDKYIDDNNKDHEVVLKNSIPSIGRTATIPIRSLFMGFDWDSGLVFLSTDRPIIEKPSKYKK